MQAALIEVAVAGAALAAIASLAERRRARRRETHGVGFMPWPAITLFATFVALIGLALALKG